MRKLSIAMLTLGCAETVTETVEVQGQQMTRVGSLEEARALVERQDARGESAEALEVAKKGRAIVRYPDGRLAVGPEVDPREIGQAIRAGKIRRHELPPGARVVPRGVSTTQQPLIYGSDSRNFAPRPTLLNPNNHPPLGSRAGFAVQSSGVLGSGYMVWGDGAVVGVTAGHVMFKNGVFQSFVAAIGLPHNGVAWTGQAGWACAPVVHHTSGFVFYGDHEWDIAVLNWTQAGCGAAPSHMSHNYRFWSMDWVPHPGPGGCGTASFNPVWNWGYPMAPCGPQGSFTWPTACGMSSSWFHTCTQKVMFSSNMDTTQGHSGSGVFLSQYPTWGTILIGEHHASLDCDFGCQDSEMAVIRSSHNESFLWNAGVR